MESHFEGNRHTACIATSKATDKIAYLETLDIFPDVDDVTSVLMTDSGSVSQRLFACMPPEKHLEL